MSPYVTDARTGTDLGGILQGNPIAGSPAGVSPPASRPAHDPFKQFLAERKLANEKTVQPADFVREQDIREGHLQNIAFEDIRSCVILCNVDSNENIENRDENSYSVYTNYEDALADFLSSCISDPELRKGALAGISVLQRQNGDIDENLVSSLKAVIADLSQNTLAVETAMLNLKGARSSAPTPRFNLTASGGDPQDSIGDVSFAPDIPLYPGRPVDPIAFVQGQEEAYRAAGLWSQAKLRKYDKKLMKALDKDYIGKRDKLAQIIPDRSILIAQAYEREHGKPLPPKGSKERQNILGGVRAERSLLRRFGNP